MRRSLRALLFLLLCISAPAFADSNVNLLIDSLKNDSSFKVRAKAAEIIGKKGDASSVAALVEALLKDENEVVRASAANALATLVGASGNAEALKALKTASEKDASALVKTEATKAAARFVVAPVSAGGYLINDVYVELGKFTNNTKITDPALLSQFQKLLDKQLSSAGKKVTSAPSGKKTLILDGSIKKCEAKSSEKSTELTLSVSIIVTREKAFLASFEQNASIELDAKPTPSDESSGRQDLMDALVPATYSDLNKNLSRWK
jgi:HEAT repeats